MPDLNVGLESHNLPTNNFGFSAERLENLEATEFTLVTLLFDVSFSTIDHRNGMKKVAEAVVESCYKSPRSDNLLFRLCKFATSFEEIHGFKRLSTIKKGDYNDQLDGSGMTALFDATENAVSATSAFGKNLTEDDYAVNGIVFVITDGDDTSSKLTLNSVKDALKNVVKEETLESLSTILIGVNLDKGTDKYLADFKDKAGLTQYVNIGDVNGPDGPKILARVADFISRSVSSTSSSIGSNAPSQPLAF